MSRSYFVCSIGAPDEEYSDENLRRCIDNKCFVLNQWAKQKGVINEIKPDDILLLKYDRNFVAYGKASSSLKDEDVSNGQGWSLKIDVNFWVVGNKTSIYGVKEAQEGGSNHAAVRKIERRFALEKMEEIGLML